MPAEIKVQTFPFTQYGIINATVKGVTEDALANQEKGLFFAMQLVMQKNTIVVNGKPIALRPGMQVTAEVKTGKRRIIEYLLTPVIKGFKESVRER
jgi:hemolysin D